MVQIFIKYISVAALHKLGQTTFDAKTQMSLTGKTVFSRGVHASPGSISIRGRFDCSCGNLLLFRVYFLVGAAIGAAASGSDAVDSFSFNESIAVFH